jgi:hypothetical protein
MGTEEKKFKLDELPDHSGSEPDKLAPAPAHLVKPKTDHRVEGVKKLNHEKQLEALTQKWHFGKPSMRWGWLVALLVLFALEKSGHMDYYYAQKAKLKEQTDGMSEFFLAVASVEDAIKHPLFFALLIPLFFKFKDEDVFFFEITFNGINAVQKIDFDLKLGPKRVSVPWGEILSVSKKTVNNRPVLEIHDAKGPRAQLIWDIDDVKKKVVKQVLKGLIANTHPFRIFIEKEVT